MRRVNPYHPKAREKQTKYPNPPQTREFRAASPTKNRLKTTSSSLLNSMEKTLILIQGHPCTGKTHLAKRLSIELGIAQIGRDEFKEILFNHLGTADQDWSKKLGSASFSLLFFAIEKMMQTGKSLIVESNFDPHLHREIFSALLTRYQYLPHEIFFESNPEVVLKRFQSRWDTGERHRGHQDHHRHEELKTRLHSQTLEPLKLSDRILRIDTSDFKTLDKSQFQNFQNPEARL